MGERELMGTLGSPLYRVTKPIPVTVESVSDANNERVRCEWIVCWHAANWTWGSGATRVEAIHDWQRTVREFYDDIESVPLGPYLARVRDLMREHIARAAAGEGGDAEGRR